MRIDVIGKFVQGASHIRSGVECQDHCKKVVLEDGTVILAVADGHGSKSCPYSGTGARLATRAFCRIMENLYVSYKEMPDQLASFLNREGDTRVSKDIDAEWKRRVVERHKRNKRPIGKLEDGTDDLVSVYKQYGSTLLGLLITRNYVFAYQLGDGDICYVTDSGLELVVEPDKILGVETHSLSRKDSWEKAITAVRRITVREKLPAMFCLSTDGYANSYKTEAEFHATIKEYLSMLKEYGCKAIADNLPGWLKETSEMGCGDDITLLIAYFSDETAGEHKKAEATKKQSEDSIDERTE